MSTKLLKKLHLRLSQFPNQNLIIREDSLWCILCEKDIFFQKKSTIEKHITGKKHLAREYATKKLRWPKLEPLEGDEVPEDNGDELDDQAPEDDDQMEIETDPSKIVREDDMEDGVPIKKSKGRPLSAPSWKHFVRDRIKNVAKCRICGKSVRTPHGATTGLRSHLRLYHGGSDDVFKGQLKKNDGDTNWSPRKSPRSGLRQVAVKTEPGSDSDEGSEMGGDDDYDDGGGASDVHMSGGEDEPDEEAEEEPNMGSSRELRRTTGPMSQRGSQPHQDHSAEVTGTCFICETKCSSSRNAPQLGSEEYRFFLMEMLGLPAGKTLSYLEQLGIPERWMALCKSCQDLIGKSIATRKKIVSLQLQLEKFQGQVLKKMKTNVKTRKVPTGIPKKQNGVVQDIRKFVQSKYSGLEMSTDFSEDHSMEVGVADEDSSDHEYGGPPDCPISDGSDADEDPAFMVTHPMETRPSPAAAATASSSSPKTGADLDKAEMETGTEKGWVGESRRSRLSRVVSCKSFQYRYSCLNCPQVKDYSVTRFILHLGVHQRRPYQCVICSQFFPADEPLRERHWTEKHSDAELPPDTNKFTIIKFSPGKIYKCESCLEGFFSDEDRSQHERSCLSPDKLKRRNSLPLRKRKPFSCKLCELRFRNFAEWRLHRALNHPQEDSMSCYYCHESFCETTKNGVEVEAKHELRMVNHLKSQHGTSKTFLECEQCGIIFHQGKDNKEHMMEQHGIPAAELFPCSICDMKFAEIWAWRRHASHTHFQSDQLFCELCGSSFIHEASLLHHKMRTHGVVADGQEVFSCQKEGCDFKSVLKHKVTRHFAMVHEGLNHSSFMCRYCGKAFKDRNYCKIHEDIHKNQETKPYTCDICGNSFAIKSYLATHKKLQHGDGRKPSGQKRSRSTFSNHGQNRGGEDAAAPASSSSSFPYGSGSAGSFNESSFSSNTQELQSQHSQQHPQLMNFGFPIYHR